MIKHVAMWKLKEEYRKDRLQEIFLEFKKRFATVLQTIPGILSFELGMNGNKTDPVAADVVLISTHKDWAALKVYQEHPLHLEIAKYVSSVREMRTVVDFEVEG
jgi:hypothetical protein